MSADKEEAITTQHNWFYHGVFSCIYNGTLALTVKAYYNSKKNKYAFVTIDVHKAVCVTR